MLLAACEKLSNRHTAKSIMYSTFRIRTYPCKLVHVHVCIYMYMYMYKCCYDSTAELGHTGSAFVEVAKDLCKIKCHSTP